MKTGLELRLGQSLAMTPQLQQSIRLLQLSTLELQVEIQQALETNPLLEVAEAGDTSFDESGEETGEDASATEIDPNAAKGEEILSDRPEQSADESLALDTSWDDYYEPDGSTSYSAPSADMEDRDPYATTSNGEESLRDHLLSQIHLSHISEQDSAIAFALVESIDGAGYLVESLEDILEMLHEDWPELGLDEVEAVLHLIQTLDPAGVGARSLAECLALQLRQLPNSDDPLCRKAQETALALCETGLIEEIGRREYDRAKRALGVTEAELATALELIQSLNPRPGAAIGSVAADYITPDVIVTARNGKWQVDLNPDIAPRLRVNQTYARMINRGSRGEDATYIRSHLQEARWFIKSLRSRNETLLNVARAIVERQHEFFEKGDIGMKPLVLREIADTLSLHESTVSRVTTQKYMLTPRGIFEFKYFFSSHVGTSDGGECSATAIRAMIKALIADENPRKPLSDAKIADTLCGEGIDVARRTIAKYREAMGIASSTDRKRLV